MASFSTTFSFPGQVVIVTGGNSGIGLAIVNEFLQAGAKVAVFDIRPLPSATANDHRMDITCDVSSEQSVEAAVGEVVEKWGTIDILVNNAGVMDAMGRPSETETKIWERCFSINVNGPFFLIRACTKYFLSKPKTEPVTTRGNIVNVCSTAAKTGAHAGAAYTASKHAVLGLSRSTAFMYTKEGIRCNAILPGGVMTNIVANSGVGEAIRTQPGMAAVYPVQALMPGLSEAADVARAVLMAAATEGMNGAEITVDKGWSTI